MNSYIREESYLDVMVSMAEKTDEEICAIAESGRMDNIIAGYLVLMLHRIGMDMQEIMDLDFDMLFGKISATEAHLLGKMYKKTPKTP